MSTFRILMIDDDPGLLETAAELLEAAGYVVLQASTAEEGVVMARGQRPHLILTDFDMPEVNGLGLVRRLKAEASTRLIPIVALTAATSQIADTLVRAGCLGYIPKPFDPETFPRLVGEFLAATSARTEHVWD